MSTQPDRALLLSKVWDTLNVLFVCFCQDFVHGCLDFLCVSISEAEILLLPFKNEDTLKLSK